MRFTTTLKLNKEFKRAYYRGKTFTSPVVVVYALKNHKGMNRIGITATKKVGSAVERNRARRIIREAYRLLEEQFPSGYDYVFVARTRTVHVKMDAVKEAMVRAINQLFLRK